MGINSSVGGGSNTDELRDSLMDIMERKVDT